MVKNFRSLNIWSRSVALVVSVYKVTVSFPDLEKYGLVAQLRRAAVSIPSNIAEGSGRKTKKDLNRFLDMAVGSLCEVETQIIIANKLNLIPKETQLNLIDETIQIRKMVITFQRSLRIEG